MARVKASNSSIVVDNNNRVSDYGPEAAGLVDKFKIPHRPASASANCYAITPLSHAAGVIRIPLNVVSTYRIHLVQKDLARY